MATASRGSQWIVPGVLSAALVLVLIAKFVWWDRQWRGTRDACEVVTALTGLNPGSEALDHATRAYFAGDHGAQSRFVGDLAGALSRLDDEGTLRTHGLSAAAVERIYLTAMQPTGVAEDQARATFREHRAEILAATLEVNGLLTRHERQSLRTAAAACQR